ncbi:helix-turn-helix domain-containing protein [Tepidamorphus sp. 3E244]|uniref:helix-turn-helix domain-containing protein n=1 Tax=Tepidamorphus sp. 3E244 TaxID=3385498 RepID=UPI0038FC9B2E
MFTETITHTEAPCARTPRRSARADAQAKIGEATAIIVREHELIFAEGDAATRRYEITDGAVMLFKVLPDGRRQLVELLGPGDMFGLTCTGDYDCSAETLVSTRLNVFHRLDCSQVPADICRMCRQLQNKVSNLHDHAVALGRKSAMEKVAGFLLNLQSVSKPRPNGHVRLPMTRQEMADYLGLTIETVSRSLSALRREGLIVFDKADWFHLPDREGLEALAG